MNSFSQMDFQHRGSHQLRFQPIRDGAHGYVFPCDETGRVDLDALSERGRNDYFYARAVVGRELSPAVVQTSAALCAPVQTRGELN
jgi:hypothetical protein